MAYVIGLDKSVPGTQIFDQNMVQPAVETDNIAGVCVMDQNRVGCVLAKRV